MRQPLVRQPLMRQPLRQPLRVDVHQHVWTAPLLETLAERQWLPFVRHTHQLTVLHCAHERPCVIDTNGETRQSRTQLLQADHLDHALVAISSPIGVETLPRFEAEHIIDAFLTGVDTLGPAFHSWGPIALNRPDPDDVDRRLSRGCVGISVPARAITGHAALNELRPVLNRLSEYKKPLFVHPGPLTISTSDLDEPLWWPALTDYVAQMQAAWLSFAALAQREYPDLEIVFALLAGGAPLLSERLDARGAPPVDVRSPNLFYDTSSYGPTAIEAMARRVGHGQLLYGSDRPVVEPTVTGREAVLQQNAGEWLQRLTNLTTTDMEVAV